MPEVSLDAKMGRYYLSKEVVERIRSVGEACGFIMFAKDPKCHDYYSLYDLRAALIDYAILKTRLHDHNDLEAIPFNYNRDIDEKKFAYIMGINEILSLDKVNKFLRITPSTVMLYTSQKDTPKRERRVIDLSKKLVIVDDHHEPPEMQNFIDKKRREVVPSKKELADLTRTSTILDQMAKREGLGGVDRFLFF